MPTRVDLTPHFEQFIRTQIDSGRYNNESEVVRAVQLEGLRSAIAAGLQGPGIPADEAFDRLEAKYQSMADHQSV